MLKAAGSEAPFPRGFDNATFVMAPDEVRTLLESSGFCDVEISVIDQAIAWPDAESAAAGILGTPFGPLVEALAPDRRDELNAELIGRFRADVDGGAVLRTTAAVIARGIALGS